MKLVISYKAVHRRLSTDIKIFSRFIYSYYQLDLHNT